VVDGVVIKGVEQVASSVEFEFFSDSAFDFIGLKEDGRVLDFEVEGFFGKAVFGGHLKHAGVSREDEGFLVTEDGEAFTVAHKG